MTVISPISNQISKSNKTKSGIAPWRMRYQTNFSIIILNILLTEHEYQTYSHYYYVDDENYTDSYFTYICIYRYNLPIVKPSSFIWYTRFYMFSLYTVTLYVWYPFYIYIYTGLYIHVLNPWNKYMRINWCLICIKTNNFPWCYICNLSIFRIPSLVCLSNYVFMGSAFGF